MTESDAEGRRRLDRVLDDGYGDVAGLDDAELLRRRADAEQEETDLSYARRLLQGRLDLLRAEAERRSSGAAAPTARTDRQLVDDLTRVLTDDRSTGAAKTPHFVTAEPSRVGEHRRVVEATVADVELSDLPGMDDARLADVTARLTELEREVSRTRAAVQRVVDGLTDAVAKRVGRAGGS